MYYKEDSLASHLHVSQESCFSVGGSSSSRADLQPMAQASVREIIFKGYVDVQEQRHFKIGQAKNFAVRFPFQARLMLPASKFSGSCCRCRVMVYCVSKWRTHCVNTEKGPQNNGCTSQPRMSKIFGERSHDRSESECHRLQSGCKITWQLYVPLIVRKLSTNNYVQLFGFYCKGIFKLEPRRYV
jgi:hypothetical protein